MGTKPEELNEKQQEILKSFRHSVADILQPDHDDYFLLRWLRARNFNEEKAEIMLRKNLAWRKQVGADTFLEDYKMPEIFAKYHPGGLIGYDKEGCPILLVQSGPLDIKGFVNSTKKIDFIKYNIYRFELTMKAMREQSKKLGKHIGKQVYILDEENLSIGPVLNKPVLETLLNVFTIFEANYPETLKRCYVINIPRPFYILYAIIKPLLSPETVDKIQIFGHDGWKEALLKDIDADVLPVHWGGTRVDSVTGDPYCSSVVNLGGQIPETYYLSNKEPLSKEADVTTTIIPKRSLFDIKLEVSETNSIIQWDIQSEDNDLALGLFYQNSDALNDLEELMPCERVECHRAPESGSFVCLKNGTYILRLDNTFSWFNPKKVAYRVHVYSPNSDITTEL